MGSWNGGSRVRRNASPTAFVKESPFTAKQEEVFHLYVEDGLSLRETARVLGLAPITVYKRLYRRRKIQDLS